ncbi:MAG: hypothetical protein KIT09_33155 [Bryobacteraceae bacterium]|nr:hypothetical protein [Bryobacteraceae bacterium]
MAGAPAQQPDPNRVATALLISPFEQDHVFFLNVFSRTNWRLYRAGNREDALALLGALVVPVVVVEEQLDQADWKDLLRAMNELGHPPKLVVASARSDGDLWAEVLNLGGYDVLARPLDQREVLYSISAAWLAWKNDAEKLAAQETRRVAGEVRHEELRWRAAAGGGAAA